MLDGLSLFPPYLPFIKNHSGRRTLAAAGEALNDLWLRQEPRENFRLLPNLRRIMGIYALFENDELLYIGQSTHLLERIARHRSPSRITSGFTGAAYFRVPNNKELLNSIEYRLIGILCPPLNKTYEREWTVTHRIERQAEAEAFDASIKDGSFYRKLLEQ